MDQNSPRFRRVAELADVLGMNKATVYRAIFKGEIKTVKVGNAVRIPPTEWKRLVVDNMPTAESL